MYPYEIVFGLDLYSILILLGYVSALFYARILFDRAGFGAKFQNLCIFASIAALAGGYGASVLTQAVYNAQASGHFELDAETGATFYGGLIGGALSFLLVYVLVGNRVLKKGETKENFWQMSSIAMGSVSLAHGFGRIGCLFAGCCYGKVTDAWYGIWNVWLGAKTVPVQLFEALFLFALTAFLTFRFLRGKRNGLFVYLVFYAVWRFLIEYLRDDDRGASLIPFLSPSQCTAVLLLFLGVGIFFLERATNRGEHA